MDGIQQLIRSLPCLPDGLHSPTVHKAWAWRSLMENASSSHCVSDGLIRRLHRAAKLEWNCADKVAKRRSYKKMRWLQERKWKRKQWKRVQKAVVSRIGYPLNSEVGYNMTSMFKTCLKLPVALNLSSALVIWKLVVLYPFFPPSMHGDMYQMSAKI